MIVVTTHDSLEPIKGGGAVSTPPIVSELVKVGGKELIVVQSVKKSLDGSFGVINNRASISVSPIVLTFFHSYI